MSDAEGTFICGPQHVPQNPSTGNETVSPNILGITDNNYNVQCDLTINHIRASVVIYGITCYSIFESIPKINIQKYNSLSGNCQDKLFNQNSTMQY